MIKGSTRVVVASIDTGVDYTHPDLYLNIWINQAEIPSAIKSRLVDIDRDGLNGVDISDGRNGIPNDTFGYTVGTALGGLNALEGIGCGGFHVPPQDPGCHVDPDNDGLFTWWAPWRNMRERNIGWRLDYVLASGSLAARTSGCVSMREYGTSDHAPVVATFGNPSSPS